MVHGRGDGQFTTSVGKRGERACAGQLAKGTQWTEGIDIKRGFIRLAYRIQSGYSNHGCLTSERLRNSNHSVLDVSEAQMTQGSPGKLRVFGLGWNPENAGFDTGGGNRINRQKAKLPSSMSYFMGCHQKVGPRFRVGLLASYNLIMKIPHRSSWQLGFQLMPDVVMMTLRLPIT